MSEEFVRFLFDQGTGIVFGAVCLSILVFFIRERNKEKNQTIRQLKDLLTERKVDRDSLLVLMGEIKAYLSTAKSLDIIANRAIAETLMHGTRRRKLDKDIESILSGDSENGV